MDEAIVEFSGGPLDGRAVAADQNPEFDVAKALWTLRLSAARQDGVIQEAEDAAMEVVWRIPLLQLSRRARAERWPDKKIAALMRYHEYRFTEAVEDHGTWTLKARYDGVK